MRIVVLAKPVPDTDGTERLGADWRLDRSGSSSVVNGNDEYAIEAALKLVEADGQGDVTLLSMAPASAPETIRKGLALGAARAVLVSDPALEGSCALSTARVLAAALRQIEFDLVLAGVDTSDGGGGVVVAALATLLSLPYCSYAARIEHIDGRVRVQRLTARGRDVVEAPLPALIGCTQALGEPRYPTLRGIMSARQKPIRIVPLAALDLGGIEVGGGVATSRVTGVTMPAGRAAARVVHGSASDGAREVVTFLAERRLI